MSIWYDGVSEPNRFLGENNDYYLQLPNSEIFRKTNGVWIRIGNIRGLKGDRGYTGNTGENGTNGINGSIWCDGVGQPSSNLGNEKDYYLDLDSKDIFSKNSNGWERIGSLLPDGRKIELRNLNGNVEYRYEGEDDNFWKTLILAEKIKGEKGDTPSIEHLESDVNTLIVNGNNLISEIYGRDETWRRNEETRISNENTRKSEEVNRNQRFEGIKSNIDTKVNDVESRMQTIERTFGSLVTGTGWATTELVNNTKGEIIGVAPTSLNSLEKIANAISNDKYFAITINNQMIKKAEKRDVYTKSEVDQMITNLNNRINELTNQGGV